MSYQSATEKFSVNQAVTASAVSENIYHQALNDSGNTTLPWGDFPEKMYVIVTCTTEMDDAGDDSTVTVTLESDSTADLATSATVHGTGRTFAATSAAGTQVVIPVPNGEQYEEYIGLRYTVAGGNLSAGTFTAILTNQRVLDNNGEFFADGRNFYS